MDVSSYWDSEVGMGTCSGADKGKVGDDLLRVLSLSGTRLASDYS